MYKDADNNEFHKLWLVNPHIVPENLLPIVKFSYYFFSSKFIDEQTRRQFLEKLRPERKDPTRSNYDAYLKNLVEKPKGNDKILSIQFFASHGFNKGGYECIVSNNYDFKTNYYELIDVEMSIRYSAERAGNRVYFLIFFAACRELFTPNSSK